MDKGYSVLGTHSRPFVCYIDKEVARGEGVQSQTCRANWLFTATCRKAYAGSVRQ